jgi:hypothetical protein
MAEPRSMPIIVAASLGLAVGTFALVPATAWVLVRWAAAAEARAAWIAERTVVLPAIEAVLEGNGTLAATGAKKPEWVGGWKRIDDRIGFPFRALPGRYHVELEFACPPSEAGSTVVLTIGPDALELTVPSTGGPTRWRTRRLGTVTLAATEPRRAELRATAVAGRSVMNVRTLTLVPAGGPRKEMP